MKKIYEIKITEELNTNIKLEANTNTEAIKIARELYNNQAITLGYDEITDTKFEVVNIIN